MKRYSFLLLLALLSVCVFSGNVRLNNMFADHMVLQRNQPIKVWGTADAGEKITVSIQNQTANAITDNSGNWKVTLKPMSAGGPFTLKVNDITIQDVLVGEVWLCSGQSNMDFDLIAIGDAETVKKASNPHIRQIVIPRVTSFTEQNNFWKSEWALLSPATAGKFSAVGYFFAEKLYKELNVPIGLIKAAWGGTNVETWISGSSLKTHPDFVDIIKNSPDSIKTQIQKRIAGKLNLVSKFQNGNLDAADMKQWKEENYNDSGWKTIYAPKFWEEQGLDGFDGVAWYRKSITLTPEQAENAKTIYLGKIDDVDDTYINGKFLGKVMDYRVVRIYDIPKNMFKAGKNQIAIRVDDGSGGGGIYGDDKDMRLTFNNNTPDFPLNGDWKIKVDTNGLAKSIQMPNAYPSLLFNSMIHPILDYGFKGAIWYQGEANAWRAKQYESLFPLLIKDWRNRFSKPVMPFYFVQLASYNATDSNSVNGSAWAELRDAQRKTLSLPYTGMAVATDVGDAKDIHPKNKKDVGYRLAYHALNKDYGFKNITPSGPLYKSVAFKNGKAYLSFNYAKGLKIRKGEKKLSGFIIAGPDKKFKYATAYISGNQVVVYHPSIKNPVAVRYGWTDVNDNANLYNSANLPASPFRTDNWAAITDKGKYVIAH